MYMPAAIAYARPVNRSMRLPSHALRAGFLVLLLLGASIKPMLASVCDVHAIGHALLSIGEQAAHADDAAGAEHQVDRDHADGKHGMLHEYDNGGAYAHIVADVVLPEVRAGQVRIVLPVVVALPMKRVSAPFRPPIV